MNCKPMPPASSISWAISCRRDGHGLVDHDVLGGFKNPHGDVEVRGIRRRDDNELDGRIRQQLIRA